MQDMILKFILIGKFKIINSLPILNTVIKTNTVDRGKLSGMKTWTKITQIDNATEFTGLTCGDFQGLVSDAFRFFKILAPVLLILFGTLDFVGALVSGDGDMKKSGERFAKRLAAAVLVFLIPTLLSIILEFAVDRGIISEYLKCWL